LKGIYIKVKNPCSSPRVRYNSGWHGSAYVGKYMPTIGLRVAVLNADLDFEG